MLSAKCADISNPPKIVSREKDPGDTKKEKCIFPFFSKYF